MPRDAEPIGWPHSSIRPMPRIPKALAEVQVAAEPEGSEIQVSKANTSSEINSVLIVCARSPRCSARRR